MTLLQTIKEMTTTLGLRKKVTEEEKVILTKEQEAKIEEDWARISEWASNLAARRLPMVSVQINDNRSVNVHYYTTIASMDVIILVPYNGTEYVLKEYFDEEINNMSDVTDKELRHIVFDIEDSKS